VKAKVQKDKAERLDAKLQNDSWHQSDTTIPFLKSLHLLLIENKLNEFDISFITNWLGEKS